MASIARRQERSTNIWPGFVDALATLLMVIIFLLLIFIMAQVFLGQALTGRDQALRNQLTVILEGCRFRGGYPRLSVSNAFPCNG